MDRLTALTFAYLDALDSGDMATVNRLEALADRDPQWRQALDEAKEEIAREVGRN